MLLQLPQNVLAKKLPLQHSVTASKTIEVSQYWISEKLDGVRGYWDGNKLWTRQGNVLNPPSWFIKGWPNTAMDGELWSNRDQFQSILACIKQKANAKENSAQINNPKDKSRNCWQKLRLMIFDLPNNKERFSKRIKDMQYLVNTTQSPYLKMIQQFKVDSNATLYQKLDKVVAQQGEGLMLHHQDAYYQTGRNRQLMKLKKYHDAEATVLQHIAGKGKYKGLLGSLLVKTQSGVTFKIGTGFSHNERLNPPKIGTTITFKYTGKTRRGVPRFASFLRIKE